MIRIEALNHNGKFRAIGIFEDLDEDRIEKCIKDNECYFLRKQKVFDGKRKVIWANFKKKGNYENSKTQKQTYRRSRFG